MVSTEFDSSSVDPLAEAAGRLNAWLAAELGDEAQGLPDSYLAELYAGALSAEVGTSTWFALIKTAELDMAGFEAVQNLQNQLYELLIAEKFSVESFQRYSYVIDKAARSGASVPSDVLAWENELAAKRGAAVNDYGVGVPVIMSFIAVLPSLAKFMQLSEVRMLDSGVTISWMNQKTEAFLNQQLNPMLDFYLEMMQLARTYGLVRTSLEKV
jgi:hypothetical protein